MRYVLAIAEHGGFTRAAAACHVVQSALSHQVARLERELGTPLFVRTSRKVELTAAGTAFLPAARSTLAAAELARAEVAATTGLLRGSLRLGSVPTFTAVDVISVLRRFHDRYPQVDITFGGARSERLVEQVRGGLTDLAFIGVPESYPVPTDLRSALAGTDRMVLLTTVDHPLASGGTGEIGLADIAGQDFADFPRGSQARAESDDAFTTAGLTRRVAYEVDHSEALLRFVRAGLGVALLPPEAVPPDDGLARVRLRDPPTRNQYVVWHRSPSPAARAFLDLAGLHE